MLGHVLVYFNLIYQIQILKQSRKSNGHVQQDQCFITHTHGNKYVYVCKFTFLEWQLKYQTQGRWMERLFTTEIKMTDHYCLHNKPHTDAAELSPWFSQISDVLANRHTNTQSGDAFKCRKGTFITRCENSIILYRIDAIRIYKLTGYCNHADAPKHFVR